MVQQAEDVITVRNNGILEHTARMGNVDQITRSQEQDKSTRAEKPLLKAHPSWWNFFWHLAFGWLIIPLIIALWRRAGLLLCVYQDRVVLKRGVLSKHITQVLISDIRSLDTKQGVVQRIFRVGDILIGTAGMSGYEIVAKGLPNPNGIADLTLRQRQWSKGAND